ncbi:histidine kinase [Halobacillus sp. Marseille-P3879]|uniref:sensor histidine kinase n=1 Tax=Halobacillus sp. Marseille-P3879 TaxID=2045014 RepID=UPI000C7CE50E|nr:histidine kinase [Halobacillus sp. Marseille-P3879]
MKSIQRRLLLMLLVFILLPYFLSIFIIYGYTKNSVEHHELENSREQIDKNSKELEQYVDEIVNLPYILYRDPDLFRIFTNDTDDSSYLEKSLENYYLMRDEMRQVRFYMDQQQESFTVYNAMVSARKANPELLEQEGIRQLDQTSEKYVIEPPHEIENYNDAAIVPESDDTMVMTFHHKVTDVLSNEFLGIISMDVDLDGLAQIGNSLTQYTNESVLIVNEENQVMYANDSHLLGKPLPSNIEEQMNSTDGGAGEDILLSSTLSGTLKDWKIVKITPSEILFQDVRRTAYTNIFVGLGVGVLGLIMISLISYRITDPIKRLTNKVQTIEAGNMTSPFEESRQDEIGYLEKHMKDMMDRINSHIDREYKLEIENKENQFRALKSQVNPHFLFNALQSIGAVAIRSKAPDVYQLVTSLSKMMRYSIQANEWVLVRDEVNYIEAYLTLQMERFRNQVNYSIDISECILSKKIPSMILQPLVENFFKHSYEEGFHDAHLGIYGEIQQGCIILSVKNNGPSLSDHDLYNLRENIYKPQYEEHNEHIGLKNIHERLVLNYGEEAGLTVGTNGGNGFLVELVIPMEGRLTQQPS